MGDWLSAPFRAVARWSGSLADRFEGTHAPSRPAKRRAAPIGRQQRAEPPASVEPEVRDLVRALRHRRPMVRVGAARQIGKHQIRAALPAIVEATHDKRREVRRAALGALLRLEPDLFAERSVAMSRTLSRAEVLADLDAMVEEISSETETAILT